MLTLLSIEREILRTWQPPINIKDVPRPLQRLIDERKAMAAEAQMWAHERGFGQRAAI